MSLKTPWRGKIVRLLCIAAVGSWAGPASAQNDIIWMDRTPTPPGPSPRFSEMAYNGVLRVTVLVSGYDGTATPHTDTWLWDGTTWTLWTPPLECPDVPAARMAHAMASDAASGLVVLFGGHFPGTGHYFNDTWIWDGHCWTCVIPDNSPGSPPARGCEHAMVYDSRRQVFVLFGGWRDNGLVQYGDTWELSFNGTNWVWEEKCTDPLLCPEKPPARYHHTLAYDAARGFPGCGLPAASSDP